MTRVVEMAPLKLKRLLSLEEKRESISVLYRAVAKAERSDIALDDPSRRAFIAALVFSR